MKCLEFTCIVLVVDEGMQRVWQFLKSRIAILTVNEIISNYYL